jgi:hypothetical protein
VGACSASSNEISSAKSVLDAASDTPLYVQPLSGLGAVPIGVLPALRKAGPRANSYRGVRVSRPSCAGNRRARQTARCGGGWGRAWWRIAGLRQHVAPSTSAGTSSPFSRTRRRCSPYRRPATRKVDWLGAADGVYLSKPRVFAPCPERSALRQRPPRSISQRLALTSTREAAPLPPCFYRLRSLFRM